MIWLARMPLAVAIVPVAVDVTIVPLSEFHEYGGLQAGLPLVTWDGAAVWTTGTTATSVTCFTDC